ncbi:MAG: hypothetical protein WBV82_28970 [Myxococcaceae bacterium]
MDAPFDAAMSEYLEACERAQSHPSWKKLRNFDWTGELGRLSSWLTLVLAAEMPSDEIRGLYFGLFNPIERRKPTAELYVCGYRVTDKNPGWWEEDPRWFPELRYANSSATRLFYDLAYRSPHALENDLEYPACFGFAVLAARALGRCVRSELILRGGKTCRFAAGFDSGDIAEVGTLTAKGFKPSWKL